MFTDSPPRFKHAFVTGATGIVGIPLCQNLAKSGARVTAFSRSSSKFVLPESITHVHGDILDSSSLVKAAHDCDVIFHVAAAVHGSASGYSKFEQMNVIGTENVVRLAQDLNAKLVHVSSVNVDDFQRGVLDDDYAATKARAEELVLNAVNNDGLDAVIVRPATVFSGVPGRAGLIADRLFSGSLKVLPVPSRMISPVWSGDLATALVKAAQSGSAGKIYTVAGPTLSTRDFVVRMAASSGASTPLLSIPAWAIVVPLQLAWWLKGITRITPPVTVEAVRANSVHDGEAAASELGFSYTPISEIFSVIQQ